MPPPDSDAGAEPQPQPQRTTAPPSEYLMALEAPDPDPVPAPRPHSPAPPAPAPAEPVDPVPPPPQAGQEITSDAVASSPPAAPRSDRAGLVLALVSVVAVLGLAAAATFGYLWWQADQELTDAREQLTADADTLARLSTDHEQQVSELEADMAAAVADLSAAQQQLAAAEQQVAALQDSDGPLSECLSQSAAAIEVATTGDLVTLADLVDDVTEVCEDARRLLAD